jgi:peptidase M28-like protein
MLDPRIYRSGLIAVALGVIVLAFSLTSQQGPAASTLAPDAFNGENAFSTMTMLAQRYPSRLPGSTNDDDLATTVAADLRRHRFIVNTRVAAARTAVGKRTLETVTGIRPGVSSGSIVVLAHRDSLHSPSVADLSGTAVLLELARVLAGQTQHRSIVLASTSGSAGEAGAIDLARHLASPVDAVISLGDLAGNRVRDPVVVPWSDGPSLAPPMLRNTLAAALSAQAGLRPGGTSLASQFVRLAFPLTISDQGPFDAQSTPAVMLSLAGERGPGADQPVAGPVRITQMGRTVLQALNALDVAGTVPAPSAYLVYGGKVVPPWAIRVLVLVLILPVVAVTIDGAARARRRGTSIVAWLVWVLAGALPFVLALLLAIVARLVGVLKVVPPGPVPAGAVPLGAAGVAVFLTVAAVIVLTLFARRSLAGFLAGRQHVDQGTDPGAGAAILVVLCVVTLVIWARNPFAAALIVPALHLWMWIVDPDLRLPRPAAILLLLVGLALPLLVVVYYAQALSLGPVGTAWNGLLLIASDRLGVLAALEWSLLLGCAASVASIALRRVQVDRRDESPITMRGPITYAGPGSLGGTESALRR